MPLESNNPKGLHWERISLPVISTITPGAYTTPNVTVDEYGRITSIVSSGAGAGVGAQNAGVAVAGGPFNVLNFLGGNITGANGGAGVLDISVSVTTGAVNVLEEGVLVGGGPFDTFNFIGGTVTAADAGGGQINVTVAAATGANTMQFEKAAAGTAPSQNIGSPIDATGIVRTVTVTVNTPYSAGATLQVEDGSANVLMNSSLINAELAGTYVYETPGNTAAIVDPQIVLAVGGGPVVGNCVVEVIYQTP